MVDDDELTMTSWKLEGCGDEEDGESVCMSFPYFPFLSCRFTASGWYFVFCVRLALPCVGTWYID